MNLIGIEIGDEVVYVQSSEVSITYRRVATVIGRKVKTVTNGEVTSFERRLEVPMT